MTRREMIFAAFPLHAQRICEAICERSAWFMFYLDVEPDAGEGAAQTLYRAFYWDSAAEGFDYWNALAEGSRA